MSLYELVGSPESKTFLAAGAECSGLTRLSAVANNLRSHFEGG